MRLQREAKRKRRKPAPNQTASFMQDLVQVLNKMCYRSICKTSECYAEVFDESAPLCDFWLGSWPDHSKHRHIRHISFGCCALLHFRYGKSRFGRSAFEPQLHERWMHHASPMSLLTCCTWYLKKGIQASSVLWEVRFRTVGVTP